MKKSELKLGDWVYAKNPITCEDMPCKIEKFDNDKVLTGLIWPDFDELSPIPLTSEILEKNGWEKGDWCFMKGLLELIPFADKTKGLGFSIYKGVRIHNIEYVHQLQHILWALGMDDNLKI